MNLVIDESVEYKKDGSKNQIGMVVVRGNSVVMLEAKDRVWNWIINWFSIPTYFYHVTYNINCSVHCMWNSISICMLGFVYFLWNVDQIDKIETVVLSSKLIVLFAHKTLFNYGKWHWRVHNLYAFEMTRIILNLARFADFFLTCSNYGHFAKYASLDIVQRIVIFNTEKNHICTCMKIEIKKIWSFSYN